MNVGEVCNREVVVTGKDSPIIDAAKLMRNYHVGDVVVVDESDGKRIPVGILTDRDMVIELLAEEVDSNSVNVGDIMSVDLLTANEEDEIWDTIKRMRSHGVRRVPVVNKENGLEGILTVDDVTDLIAEQLRDLVDLVAMERRRERESRS